MGGLKDEKKLDMGRIVKKEFYVRGLLSVKVLR